MPTTNNSPQEVPQNGGTTKPENGNEVQQNNVGPISTAIEKITTLRTEHLPLIQEKEKMAQELTDALNIFEDWQRDISTKQSDATLVDLRQKVSDLNQIANYDITALKDKLAKYKAQVERLRKRFGRKNVQISLIGNARQGKSSILQTITGLEDDVIPTSSGTDCTGAISIIYNRPGEEFDMDIEFYSQEEFVNAINQKLIKFFGENNPYLIRTINEIPGLKKSIFDIDNSTEQEGFYQEYVERFEQYKSCLMGNRVIHFSSKEHVIEYVAKYRYLKKAQLIPQEYIDAKYEIKEGKSLRQVIFAKYVTVKKAEIQYEFQVEDARKIVAVDTIGLGNALTNIEDKKNMFKVLSEDTDIAIYTYLVPNKGASKSPDTIKEVLNEVYGELSELNPEKWVVAFINYYSYENFPVDEKLVEQGFGKDDQYETYSNTVRDIVDWVSRQRYGKDSSKLGNLALCKSIDARDNNQVKGDFVIPVLRKVTSSLYEIDQSMATAANESGKAVFDEIHTLCVKLAEIKSKVLELNPQREIQFITNFEALEYKYQLELLIEKLRKERDSVNPTISNDLKEHLDKIDEAIPKTEEMQKALRASSVFAKQAGVANIILNVYAKILKGMKTVSSKSISTIQLNAQNLVAEILFKYGLWENLNLANANESIQPVERLRLFTEQKLVMYPNLHQAIKSVLDFKMNIEGLLYSSCILRCEALKDFPSIDTNMTQDEVISEVKSFLQKKVPSIKKELEFDFGIKKDALGPKKTNLSLKMPNLLVWCLVDTFYQELASKDCQNELQTFYREYQDTIWEDKVKEQTGLADLVNKYVKALQCFEEFDSEAKYLISITNKD